MITDWIASNDLVVINRGDKPTFRRENYGSILDLTIATQNISPQIKNWEVCEAESLSDHDYITFDISEDKQSKQRKPVIHGWQVRKLNKERLAQMLNEIEMREITDVAGHFTDTLTRICENTMPKRKLHTNQQPMYWWNEEIADLRKECIRKKRQYTRTRRRQTTDVTQQHWLEYKRSRKKLRLSIKKSKKRGWKALCDSVDNDIWGDGYKIVMKGLIGYPPRTNMTMPSVLKVVDGLFPKHAVVEFEILDMPQMTPFTVNEILQSCAKLKTNKAPGPGNVPAEIIKQLTQSRPDYALSVYNRLASNGNFPEKWKTAKLVLIRKGDKPIDEAASFRPICLLDLAPEKTVLTKKRKVGHVEFTLRNTKVIPSKAIKYLGVWLDNKLTFTTHVLKVVEKVERTTSALAALMPNIGGPRESKRRLLSSVIHSQILYAAPVWEGIVNNKGLTQKLTSVQRTMNLRICSAYRTTSADAVGVIAGVISIDLQIRERAATYRGIQKGAAKERVLAEWQERWENSRKGRWTFGIIPDIRRWINRSYGETDYFLTQALTGHGCFKKYLFERRRSVDDQCPYCKECDTVEHTLFNCRHWSHLRQEYAEKCGLPFDIGTMGEKLTDTEASWKEIYETVRKIIETKEADARLDRH
ncbi:hypothetical protein NQ315_014576 [Exocentrus adspersus]|uniref:Endonuclease/exonuclease/phosphatase domain-containing protein n=1 Tax=Exocentrus adspersus TaxID=1586481 RepID=A0AAV8VF37_9CUCU|nr:hypothetical protein NQ315_014576 [Exocentrus adspersus]